MSFIQKIFGAAPAPAPAAPNQMAKAGDIPTQQTAQTSANGVIPAESPLDKFSKVWEPTPVDPNAAAQQSNAVTPEQLMEAAGKVDFAKVLDPAAMQAIIAGGEGAVGAFTSSMQKIAQTVYGHSAFATTKIVEQAVSQAEDRFAAKLPGLINSQSSKNELLQQNVAFNNPAVAPIVQMIHAQIAAKYPNATSNEITAMAKEMMQGAAQVFNPAAAPSAKEQKANAGEDWSKYLES